MISDKHTMRLCELLADRLRKKTGRKWAVELESPTMAKVIVMLSIDEKMARCHVFLSINLLEDSIERCATLVVSEIAPMVGNLAMGIK